MELEIKVIAATKRALASTSLFNLHDFNCLKHVRPSLLAATTDHCTALKKPFKFAIGKSVYQNVNILTLNVWIKSHK